MIRGIDKFLLSLQLIIAAACMTAYTLEILYSPIPGDITLFNVSGCLVAMSWGALKMKPGWLFLQFGFFGSFWIAGFFLFISLIRQQAMVGDPTFLGTLLLGSGIFYLLGGVTLRLLKYARLSRNFLREEEIQQSSWTSVS